MFMPPNRIMNSRNVKITGLRVKKPKMLIPPAEIRDTIMHSVKINIQDVALHRPLPCKGQVDTSVNVYFKYEGFCPGVWLRALYAPISGCPIAGKRPGPKYPNSFLSRKHQIFDIIELSISMKINVDSVTWPD